MSVIFAKPRFHYDSYTDFWRLVELSGFDYCWIDEINLKSRNTYIVSPVNDDEWHLSWWRRIHKTARLILWDLERPKPRGGIRADRRYLHSLGFDEIWHSDAQMARDLGTKFVILGSDKKLGKSPFRFKRYDFAPMCYVNGRRGIILEQLKRIAPNAWGRQRQDILRSSKFGLSIHQDNDLYIEPLRLALFASYELPIISEKVVNASPLNGRYFPGIDDYLLHRTYDKLVDFCSECLAGYELDCKHFKNIGKEIKQKLCFDYNFGNMVRYAAS